MLRGTWRPGRSSADLVSLFRGQNYSYWAFVALAIGLFTSVADLGSVTVALPTIANHFQTDLPTTQWVVIGYTLTISAFLLPMGRLADIAGRKTIYILGFLIFVAGALAAGMSPNIVTLIIAKVVQGVGAAMTQGTSMAMIIASFPSQERGKALGLQMSIVGAGGVAGPAIGGLIVGELGWHWVFFGTAIMGVVATIAALVIIDPKRIGQTPGVRVRFDWAGAIISTAALVVFLQAMTWAPMLGYGSPLIVAGFAGFVALLTAFVVHELRTPSPMMDVRLFKRRLFTLGVLASYLNFLGMQSVRFLMPFYLQAVLGLSPTQVGLVIVPGAVGMMVIGPLSGRFSDRFGWRWFTMGGLLTSITGLLILSTLRPDSHLAIAMCGMVLQSAGIGMFNAPNNSSILSAVESTKYGVISGFLNLVRNSGNLCSLAIATAIVTATMGSLGYEPTLASVSTDGGEGVLGAFTSGLRVAYRAMAVVVLVGVVASAFKGKAVRLEQNEEDSPDYTADRRDPVRQGAD